MTRFRNTLWPARRVSQWIWGTSPRCRGTRGRWSSSTPASWSWPGSCSPTWAPSPPDTARISSQSVDNDTPAEQLMTFLTGSADNERGCLVPSAQGQHGPLRPPQRRRPCPHHHRQGPATHQGPEAAPSPRPHRARGRLHPADHRLLQARQGRPLQAAVQVCPHCSGILRHHSGNCLHLPDQWVRGWSIENSKM